MPKNTIEHIMQEIRATFVKLILFERVLNTLIVFLGMYLIFYLFSIPKLYAGIAALLYFFITAFKKIKRINVDIIEKKYPDLDERLRTARDSLDMDNFMVDRLRQEVDEKMKKVSVATFFDIKQSYIKVGVISFLCFLIIFSTVVNLRVIKDYNAFITSVSDKFSDASTAVTEMMVTGNAEENGEGVGKDTDDIFGDKSALELGNEEVVMELKLGEDEIDYSKPQDAQEQDFEERFLNSNTFVPSSDSTYQEEFSKGERKIIKNYFTGIASDQN